MESILEPIKWNTSSLAVNYNGTKYMIDFLDIHTLFLNDRPLRFISTVNGFVCYGKYVLVCLSHNGRTFIYVYEIIGRSMFHFIIDRQRFKSPDHISESAFCPSRGIKCGGFDIKNESYVYDLCQRDDHSLYIVDQKRPIYVIVFSNGAYVYPISVVNCVGQISHFYYNYREIMEYKCYNPIDGTHIKQLANDLINTET
jgi:hypothetical protein